jgi:hypothetical protein
MDKRVLIASVALAIVFGCAAASKKPKQASDPDAPVKDDTSAPAEEKSDMGKPMAMHEHDYLEKCVKDPSYKAWCECAWGIYGSTISLGEMNKGNIAPEKLKQVKAKSVQVCGTKMPDALVKEAFVEECQQANAKYKPFCECLWPGLRKAFKPEEIADKEFQASDKFAGPGNGVARACSGKLPEAEVKADFLKTCAKKEGAQSEKLCDCVWTQVRGTISHAEIALSAVAGTIDIHKGQQKVHKACDKFKVE